MPTYVALDLYRDDVHRCRLEPHPEGANMKHSRFPNTREGWDRFIETETGPDTWVAFEVTGNEFEAYDRLSPHVGKVLLTKATAGKEKGSGRKTDRADTERLGWSWPRVPCPPSGSRPRRCAMCVNSCRPALGLTVGARRWGISCEPSCGKTGPEYQTTSA